MGNGPVVETLMAYRSTKPDTWIKTFRNILELEQANGFNDKAVIGGMDAFVRIWAGPMADFLGESPTNPALARLGYSPMTPAERQIARQLRGKTNYSSMTLAERSAWAGQWRLLLDTAPLDSLSASTTGNNRPAKQPAEPRPAKATNTRVRKTAPPGDTKTPPGSPTAGLTVDAPVTSLKRVDAKLAARLARLDVATVRDLLYLFPRRHLDYSVKAKIAELSYGQERTVEGEIMEAREVRLGQRRGPVRTEAVLSDDTGNIRITWFGQTYLARTLKPGAPIAVSGKVDVFQGRLVFESPEYEILRSGQPAIHTGRLLPVYPLTAGLTGRNLRSLTWQTLEGWLGGIEEYLPPALLTRTKLMPLPEAIRQAHYPDDLGKWASARRRLAFDELLTLQLSVLARRQRDNQLVEGVTVDAGADLVDGFIASLPFSLTGAQKQCLEEILADLRRGTPPMNRLLQGEVGSGKTVVVLVALLATIAAGYQGAIMVPTEVLAEQHFQTVTQLLSGLTHTTQVDNLLTASVESLGRPITVGLLTGSTRARPRRKLTGMAAEGSLDLLIGTQALIQEGVELPRLALAVMDEQHRFGVMQRSALRQKSLENPHTLVMSATPIPRTLTLTLYGDLDISTISELPPGRQEIRTRWPTPDRREVVYGFIRKEVQAGRQAFIVYPLIDESDAIEAKAATDEHRRLSHEVFPELRLGLLHGRMPAKEKDRVMRQFRDGELDILVTTAVVEVGIDVPNATVMLIEGADRFGLSQLHQFRGRVGRGEHQSYCILMSENASGIAQERLSALQRTQDGFQLAEVDLEMRGPGDFFGTRQSGLPNLRMAQLSDRELLDLARKEANAIIEEDPTLALEKHAALAGQMARFMERVSAEFS